MLRASASLGGPARRRPLLGSRLLPGGTGDAGGDDVGGVPVEAAAGPTWWTRLFQLSECVSLILKCRFGVGGGWFAAAVVGGVDGPVAG